MARTNVARRQGDDFQARMFWLSAASLLDPASPVIRVAYECGPKAFDDVLIEYDPYRAPRDHKGCPILIEYIQCKWHTKAGTFGYADLVDPGFINANRHSLLQRAYQAYQAHGSRKNGLRFQLTTNWRILRGDPLLSLIGKASDAIDVDQLFIGRTDGSRMGKVRKSWRGHLQIDDRELREFAGVLAVAETPESLRHLRERLDDRFSAVGLKRVPWSNSDFLYDDLIIKLSAQGRVDFDRNTFRAMADHEQILDEHPGVEAIPTVGVRSFMHPIDPLEHRCDRVLDLVRYFDGRYVREDAHWQKRIAPELRAFLRDSARAVDRLRLVLDAHVSLAFAAGAFLDVKSGKRIEIEQRTAGRRFWSIEDAGSDSHWPGFVFEDEDVIDDGTELAIAVGLTHDVSPAVSNFVRRRLHRVRQVVHCRPRDGASQHTVSCGRHAWELAESVARYVLAIRGTKRMNSTRVHLFVAAPNGFAFFLGQQQRVMGPAYIYEWDLEGWRDGGYSLGVRVPG